MPILKEGFAWPFLFYQTIRSVWHLNVEETRRSPPISARSPASKASAPSLRATAQATSEMLVNESMSLAPPSDVFHTGLAVLICICKGSSPLAPHSPLKQGLGCVVPPFTWLQGAASCMSMHCAAFMPKIRDMLLMLQGRRACEVTGT